MLHVLAAILMGVEYIWNQPAIFNYYDHRYSYLDIDKSSLIYVHKSPLVFK